MSTSNLFRRYAFLAVFVGSFSVAGPTQAKTDFDSLLADIDFGATAAQVDEAAPRSAALTIAQATELAPQADALVDPPAVSHNASMAMPSELAASEALPAPSTTDSFSADANTSAGCGGQCGNSCNGQCGNSCGHNPHRRITEGFCQPYTPPQMPNSTFYQYWRSNACNTHVWDGFRNRCHPNIDLSIHRKSNCGCGTGACSNVGCGNGCNQGCGLMSNDCGPLPAEWCGKQSCDSGACDGQ